MVTKKSITKRTNRNHHIPSGITMEGRDKN